MAIIRRVVISIPAWSPRFFGVEYSSGDGFAITLSPPKESMHVLFEPLYNKEYKKTLNESMEHTTEILAQIKAKLLSHINEYMERMSKIKQELEDGKRNPDNFINGTRENTHRRWLRERYESTKKSISVAETYLNLQDEMQNEIEQIKDKTNNEKRTT